jgi:hypothetical protein
VAEDGVSTRALDIELNPWTESTPTRQEVVNEIGQDDGEYGEYF